MPFYQAGFAGFLGPLAAALLIGTPLTGTEAHAARKHTKVASHSEAPAAETSYWDSVRNSSSPVDLQAYLNAYPHGAFTAQARNRLAALQRTGLPAAPPPPPPNPDLSGRSRLWRKDARTNCWVYDPNTSQVTLNITDILPGFLFKPLDSEGNPQNVTLGDLLPGLLRKKLSGEQDPADAIASWDGPCENQLASGSGTLIWSAKGKTIFATTGVLHAGVLTGHGVNVYASGDRYEGNFVNSVPEGHGMSASAGGTYDGDFHNGKQNGHGVFTLPNRDRVEGNWTNGVRDPAATYIFSDNAKYVGNIPGDGTLTTPDGQQQAASASQDEQGAINVNVGGQ